jgi:hypothetical protein
MLSQSDIEWIRSNRAEVTEGRTELVDIVRLIDGEPDPYTGESSASEIRESVSVVWKEYSTVANGDRDVIGGVELRQDDVKVTFHADVDLTSVNSVERGGVAFTIVAIDEKGIGATNRLECVARRTT